MGDEIKAMAMGVTPAGVGAVDSNKQGTQRVVQQPAKAQPKQPEEVGDTFVRAGAQAETPEELKDIIRNQTLLAASEYTNIMKFGAESAYKAVSDTSNPFKPDLTIEKKSNKAQKFIDGASKFASMLSDLGDYFVANDMTRENAELKSFYKTCELLGTSPEEFSYNFPGFEKSAENSDSSKFMCLS